MRFLADMGVSYTVVLALRDAGHDVVHLRDEGLQRLPNGEIFTKAEREGRIVLTFDLDFAEIVASLPSSQTSVIVFRLRNTRRENVWSRLQAVLVQSSEALRSGAIVSVEDTRHRVRRLPIGE